MSGSPLETLKSRMFDVNALRAATAIMDWDQQCLMPPAGADARANHLSILGRLAHEIFTADETQKALEEASKSVDPNSEDGMMCRVVQRDMDLATKLPSELVARKGKLSAEGHEKWVKARSENNFAEFAPSLEELFDLAREEAECYGYEEHIYDALLDTFEEGATAADCTRMFNTLREPTVKLIEEIKESPAPVDDSFLIGEWNQDDQEAFTKYLATALGYDFNRGRQDTAPHPFCTGWSVNDTRITTRYIDHLMSCAFSTLHETGHALYEMGSPQKWDRTPLAGGVSLGIHESQSRLWENLVGRSREFVGWMEPELKNTFPVLKSRSTEELYRAINKVEPSFIRVEADEVTYNMHVMIRFEIECAILTNELAVKDLPEAWNAKYQAYLGITPPNDSKGCLQDVHWSMGAIGYFPTYSMGNLLSCQFWAAMLQDVPSPQELIAQGNFSPIHDWLRENIYRHGRSIPPKELVQKVTGKPIGADDYVAAIGKKYREIYKIETAAV